MAGDWIGWACVAIVTGLALAIGGGHAAASWPTLVRWWRIRRYAVRHAEALLADARAGQLASREVACLRSEVEHLRAEIARASRPRLR